MFSGPCGYGFGIAGCRMLEGIADIEAEAYRLLRTMGASPLTKVICALGAHA
jgi:hypothetical protein